MSDILKTLEQILHETEDYISYEAALYFHGLTKELPARIAIVTSGRRRPRNIDGYQIDFVYHNPKRPRESQLIHADKRSLRIARLTQAVVDIVADAREDVSPETFAELFWRLPYNIDETINLARQTGNSALKRILFWGLWAGRLSFPELPAKLERTPVNLFPGEKEDLLWEGSIQVFFPEFLLDFIPGKVGGKAFGQENDWRTLRENLRLKEFSKTQKWLPIREDNRKKSIELLEEFYHSELKFLAEQDLSGLLLRLHNEDSVQTNPISDCFCEWVRNTPSLSKLVGKQLQKWVKNILGNQTDTKLWEMAFIYAPTVNETEAAFERINKSAAQIFISGHCRGVENLVEAAEKSGKTVPVQARLLNARIQARLSHFDSALKELKKALKGNLTAREEIDIAFASGVINRQAGNIEESVRQLNHAAQCAEKAGLKESASAMMCAIGNVYLDRGELKLARRNYLKAAASFPKDRNTPLIANLQTNLGLVEFRSGNLKKADCFFSLAATSQQVQKNLQGELTTMTMLARIRLARGQIQLAIEKLQEVEKLQERMASLSDRIEIWALLAFCNELTGRPVNSDQYWKKVLTEPEAKLSAPAEFLIKLLQGIQSLLRGEFVSAADHFATLSALGQKKSISANDVAFADFYHALALQAQKSTKAYQAFKKLPITLFEDSDDPFTLFAKAYVGLTFPGDFIKLNMDKVLTQLLDSDYYEPTWIFIAEQLDAFGSSPAQNILKTHMEKTLPEMLSLYEQRLPFCRRMLKKLTRQKSERNTYTLLSRGRQTVIDDAEYQHFLEQKPELTLVFNSVTGILYFSEKKTTLKPGSILCRMLTCLFSAHPEGARVESLYEMVWGGKYEPEVGKPAMKAAVMRLRKSIQKVCTTARIDAFGREGLIKLRIESPFKAII